jgi:homoserine kinase
MALQTVSVRVPATTANLGPGFDSLGIALKLYNTVTLRRGVETLLPPMIGITADAFFREARCKRFSFSFRIAGAVPISRGLGSSVTVRLGVLAGLNELAGKPLKPEQVLSLVVRLEGHPDNAVPAFYGGFAACAAEKFLNAPVSPRLKFIALVPDMLMETKAARRVLPKTVPLAAAVQNLQNTALITAAFCARNYRILPGLFRDNLHQPYRARLLPAFGPVLEAAEKAGALGGFLSGSGSTLMALALARPKIVCKAMLAAALRAKTPSQVFILTADNSGHRILRNPAREL